jgi:hypothetical protein
MSFNNNKKGRVDCIADDDTPLVDTVQSGSHELTSVFQSNFLTVSPNVRKYLPYYTTSQPRKR